MQPARQRIQRDRRPARGQDIRQGRGRRMGAWQDALLNRGGGREGHHRLHAALRRRPDIGLAEGKTVSHQRQGTVLFTRLRHQLERPHRRCSARRRRRDHGCAQRFGHIPAHNVLRRARTQLLLRRLPGRHRPRRGAHDSLRHRHRSRLSVQDHV